MNRSQPIPPHKSPSHVAVVILAAGQGTRMRSSLPKVLHSLAGKPLLEHVMASAKQVHPDQLMVVIGHQSEKLANYLTVHDVQTVVQNPQLGTGHALSLTLEHLSEQAETILVLYGDVPLLQSATLIQLVKECAGEQLVLLTEILDHPQGYGRIIRDKSGNVTGIREQKDATDEEQLIQEVNTGIMAIPKAKLFGWIKALTTNNAQGEYYLTDIVSLAFEQNYPIKTLHPTFSWEAAGVNSQRQLAQLERKYQCHLAEKLMENGVNLLDPHRLDIRGELICAQDVSIDVGCVFEGRVELKRGVKIGPYCIVKNSTIEQDTQVMAFSHIEEAHIGQQNRIGPYARLRPGTLTEDLVHIGNFVEIKKTTLGESSKANHLSYLGDSTVGKRVNVGAGTITCNYDGVNKHQTIIEDDVFIGSDSQLVAPVTIQRGSTIGAGSTIVNSTPPEQLTLSRSKQVSISRWKRPVSKKD